MTGGARQLIRAAEAFEASPRNAAAKRCAAVTLVLFLLTSLLILTAALIDWFTGNRFLAECAGWTGIATLNLCVAGGLRYAVLTHSRGN